MSPTRSGSFSTSKLNRNQLALSAIAEPEALQMLSRHIDQELQKVSERHETIISQLEEVELHVASLETAIKEKKDFFMSNDQANNLLLMASETGMATPQLRAPSPPVLSPKAVQFSAANGRAERKYDSETSLVNIMKRKLAQLQKIYEQISEELASQYSIAYSSKNPMRTGTWRRIDVRVGKPGLLARARRGYYSPTGQ